MDKDSHELTVLRADQRYPSLKEYNGPYNVRPQEVLGWGRSFADNQP